MNTVKRLAKNTGAVLLAHVVEPACSFILVLFVARSLGVSGLGKFSIALSLFFIFQTISSLGFTHLITREVAQDRSKAGKYLINGSFVGFFFSVLMAGTMCLTGYLLDYSPDTALAIRILSLALIPATLALVCQSICSAFEKLEFVSLPMIIGGLFKVLLGLYILFKGYGLTGLITVILGSHFFIFFMTLYFVLQCIRRPLYKVDLSFCKWIIGSTPIFALIFVFNTIRWNTDILMLSKLRGPMDVGFYSAAHKLMKVGRMLIMAYAGALQPVIFRLFKASSEKFSMACRKSIKYLFIAILPIAVGTTLLSDRFILLLYKNEFLASANVLRILIWILVLSIVNIVLAYALIASNNQKINLHGNIINLACNVGLNILLIPKFGFLGAGIASFTSSFVFLTFQYSFVSKNLFKVNFGEIAAKPIICAALMAIIILLCREFNLFLLISVSAVAYVLFLLALRTFSQSEIQLLRRVWEKEKGVAVVQSPASSGPDPLDQ
ncbi:MAG: flippase [bacterium]